MSNQRFDYGELSMTEGIMNRGEPDREFTLFIGKSIHNHVTGDWGDLAPDCIEANQIAIKLKKGLATSYYEYEKFGIFIVTDFDIDKTTVMTSEEHEKKYKCQ